MWYHKVFKQSNFVIIMGKKERKISPEVQSKCTT